MTVGIVPLEETFLSLPRAEREAIISYGAAIRLASLRKRLFLAQSKVQDLEAKYHMILAQLEIAGLPDDANYEMHEDYVMWRHWNDTLETVSRDIAAIEEIASRGLYPRGSSDVRD
jgi:hypothetical protein